MSEENNITVLPAGHAHGIPTNYCHPTGKKGAPIENQKEYTSELTRIACLKIANALISLGYTGTKKEKLIEKEYNREWIFYGDDFKEWCDDANRTPESVKAKAKEIMEIGVTHRLKKGQGKRYLKNKAKQQLKLRNQ